MDKLGLTIWVTWGACDTVPLSVLFTTEKRENVNCTVALLSVQLRQIGCCFCWGDVRSLSFKNPFWNLAEPLLSFRLCCSWLVGVWAYAQHTLVQRSYGDQIEVLWPQRFVDLPPALELHICICASRQQVHGQKCMLLSSSSLVYYTHECYSFKAPFHFWILASRY